MNLNAAGAPTFALLFLLLVAAGAIYLIAKMINNPQTRNLGVGILAAIGLILGFVLLTWTSHRVEMSPATVDYRVQQNSNAPWQAGTMRVETDGSVTQTYAAPTVVYESGVGISNWARWAVIGLVIVAIIVASRSRQAAVVVAGLAVVAALGFVYAARSSSRPRQIALVAPVVETAPAQAVAPVPAEPTPAPLQGTAQLPRKNYSDTTTAAEKPRLNKTEKTVEESAKAVSENVAEAAKAIEAASEHAESEKKVEEVVAVKEQSSAGNQPTPAAKPRPAWIDEPPSFSGGVYTATVSSSRHASVEDCERELDSKLWGVLWNHAQKHIPQAGYLPYNVPLVHEFVDDQYPERHESPLAGTMWQVHSRLKVDDADRRRLESQIRDIRVAQRVEEMTGVAAGVLGTLGVVYCALRFGPRRKKPAEDPAVAA